MWLLGLCWSINISFFNLDSSLYPLPVLNCFEKKIVVTISCFAFIFYCSMGWFSRNSLNICPWTFDEHVSESPWLPFNSNIGWIIRIHWFVTLIFCFKYLCYIWDLQCSVWIWRQLHFCVILCGNVTVLWKKPFYSNWHSCFRNRAGCSWHGTSSSRLVGLLWLEKNLSSNCGNLLSCLCPWSYI